jgi:type I restriction enzyme S subunit
MTTIDIPHSWSKTLIREVLEPLDDGRLVHQGWSPRCETFPSTSNEIWGVLKTTSIQDGYFLPEYNKQLPNSLTPRPLLEVKAGDLLLTCAGPRIRCGVASLVRTTRPKLLISGKMYRMRANETLVDSRFLEAFLREHDTQLSIDEMKKGISESGMNITHEKFATLTIPLPPINEQKRIADKLDQTLAIVERAKERLARVPEILKQFRQSVLAAATDGRLTEEWSELNQTILGTAKDEIHQRLEDRKIRTQANKKFKEPARPDMSHWNVEVPENWSVESVSSFAECLDSK